MRFAFEVTCPGCGGQLDHDEPRTPTARTRACDVTCVECDAQWAIDVRITPARRARRHARATAPDTSEVA